MIHPELVAYPQWVVWRLEALPSGKLTKVPYSPIHGGGASVTNPKDWGTYEQATAAAARYSGIGFVLTEADPFAFIDLDYTENPAELQLQTQIFEQFDSWAERSPSGRGLHIICRGQLPTGRKRGKIEVYTKDRYMTVTGDVFRDVPILDYSEQLLALYSYLAPEQANAFALTYDKPETDSDETILDKAWRAENGTKFVALFEGHWDRYYTSQSEADFALIDILAFWTDNKQQVHRLFMSSRLADREKAKRPKYVWDMIHRSFDRKSDVDVAAIQRDIAAAHGYVLEQQKAEPVQVSQGHGSELHTASTLQETGPVGLPEFRYTYPPGLIGEIARFIYAAAPYPIHEVAICAAIAFGAGMAGRGFNISKAGLNQYVFLVGDTGVGKDAISTGFDVLMPLITKDLPNAKTFFGPGEIASPQALVKHLAEHPCFMSWSGEIGDLLQDMTSKFQNPNMRQLRRFLLSLWSRSGERKQLNGTIYSDKDKNVGAIQSPAMTWFGETTGEGFYDRADEESIAKGFIPRFLTFHSNAVRPAYNDNHESAEPSEQLISRLLGFASQCLSLSMSNRVQAVGQTPEARAMLKAFQESVDKRMRDARREVFRHLWNRAHLKALKLAALIAVGENELAPVVSATAAQWAIDIVSHDVFCMLSKLDSGDIVMSDVESQQIHRVQETIRDWYLKPWEECKGYAPGLANLHLAKIVPYAYLQRRCSGLSIFKTDRNGPSYALHRACKLLQDRGDVIEIERHVMGKEYGTAQRAFAVSNFSAFRLL